MYQPKFNIIDLEKYFLYGLILSMATYAVPSLRIVIQETPIPIGTLILPFSVFLLIVRCFYMGKFVVSKALISGLFLLYFSIALSSFFSINIEIGRIVKFSVFLIIPILFTSTIKDYKSLKLSVCLVITIGVILGIYGFYGYLTGNVGDEAEKSWWCTYARYYGIHYSAATRNSDLYFITIPLIFLLGLLFFDKLRFSFLKIPLIAVSLLFYSGIVLSFSRGAWISIVAIFMVLLLVVWKNRPARIANNRKYSKVVLLIITAALILIASLNILDYFGMSTYLTGRAISIISPGKADQYLQEIISNRERIEIIKATFSIIASNPLGVGPDNLKHFYPSFGFDLNHPENAYLHILAENGVFGFLGYSIFVFYPLLFLYKKIKTVSSNDWVSIGIFLTSLYLAISYMFNVEVFNFYIWIVHSIIWCPITIRDNNVR